VIGWFQGRLEWGPRALGNRSILGDPRRADMKDILNLKIKRRESFRPFAPSILREAVPEWFEADAKRVGLWWVEAGTIPQLDEAVRRVEFLERRGPGLHHLCLRSDDVRRDDAALRGKTVAVAGASTGQYGAMWAQQDLKRVLGVAGARVVCPELPVSRAQDVCDEDGGPSPLVAERLRVHLEQLCREAVAVPVAAAA